MLVDDVDPVDIPQTSPDLPIRGVGWVARTETLVRLQPLNQCYLWTIEIADRPPLDRSDEPPIAPDPGLAKVDGEGRVLRAIVGDRPVELTDVELVGEVVEGGPKVVVGIPDDHRPRRVKGLDLSDVEAVFQSFALARGRHGPSPMVHAPVEVEFEGTVVVDCAFYPRYGVCQTSGHLNRPGFHRGSIP
jgi:hypothetical protein